jgi:hypothetical protein
MRDDSNTRPDDEFSTESLFCRATAPGDTTDDQFTFVRRAILSINDIGGF